MHLKFTSTQTLFINVQHSNSENLVMKMLNPVDSPKTGVAYFITNQDAFIVEVTPNKGILEIFISPGNKRQIVFIYQQYLSGELDNQKSLLRKNALPIVAAEENIKEINRRGLQISMPY